MSDPLPDPLVPDEVDLRGFRYMPLDIERLKKSRAWLECKAKPELAFYMINLWTAAWLQVPAGSLEDDDIVLADLAMCSRQRWWQIRDRLLRGWVQCSDKRYHNPTVCELALEAWAKRTAYHNRTAEAREARKRKRLGLPPSSVTSNVTTTVTDPVTGAVTTTVTALKGIEREEITPTPRSFRRGQNGSHASSTLPTAAEPWEQRMRGWRQNQVWNQASAGFKPGTPGCRVPHELLTNDEIASQTRGEAEPPVDEQPSSVPPATGLPDDRAAEGARR